MIEKSKLQSIKSKLLSVTRQKIETIVFFVMFYLYLFLVVDLRLVPSVGGNITQFPVFYRGWDFFSNAWAMPGGLVDYLSSFLVQFFYISWAGAIVVTLQAFLIYFFTRKFLDSLKMSSFSYVSFTGPIVILALYNKYFYFFNIATGLLVALVFANLYILLKQKKGTQSLLVFLILSMLLYPIAGASLLMFCFLCMIYEMIARSRFIVAGAELVSAFAIAYIIGLWIYDIGTTEAFTRLLPIHENLTYIIYEKTEWIVLACSLYLFLPLISVFLWPVQKIPVPRFLSSSRYKKIIHPLCTYLFLILASLSLYFTYNSRRKNMYKADYYACHRNWPKALEAAERVKEHPFMLFTLDRALYHMGRLPQDMFLYPQQIDGPFYALCIPPQVFQGIHWPILYEKSFYQVFRGKPWQNSYFP